MEFKDWAPFAATGVSLVTAGINIWVSIRQGNREHRNELRREVFVESAGNIEKQMKYLASFGVLDTTEKERFELIDGVASSNAMVHLIASNDTIDPLNEASEYFNDAVLDLTKLWLGVLEKRTTVNKMDARIKRWKSERGAADAFYVLNGIAADQKVIDEFQAELAPLIAQLGIAKTDFENAHTSLLIEIQKKIRIFAQLLIKVNICVRKYDLDMPFADPVKYEAQMLRILEKRLKVNSRFINDA